MTESKTYWFKNRPITGNTKTSQYSEDDFVSHITAVDGNTITFTSNKFTMPSSDVIIDVTFVPENPGTATMGLFIITCLLMIGTGIILSIKNIKQIKWLKN